MCEKIMASSLANVLENADGIEIIVEHPAFDEERAYWSGQPLGRLYANLADEVPPQYGSPLVETAKSKMSGVISACAVYYRENGEAGFEDFALTRLAEAAAEVRRYMRRNPY